MSVLLLNASYEPLTVINWRRAIVMILEGECELLEQAEDRSIRTCGGEEFPFPVVVRLLNMVKAFRRGGKVPWTRASLRARDDNTCQVRGCHSVGTTVDHIVPRCRGGETTWENTVLMCKLHNQRKGSRSLAGAGLGLKTQPRAPSYSVVLRTRAHPLWVAWLPNL